MTCPDPATMAGYDPSFCIGGTQGTYECSVYIEAGVGDKGKNKASNPYWWLSTDLWLSDSSGNPYSSDTVVGQNYFVNVRPHISTDAGCTLSASDSSFIVVDLYLGLPNLVPTAPKLTTLNLDPSTFVSQAGETGLVPMTQQKVAWSPTTSDLTSPNGPTHKCLVARCYPNAQPGTSTNFFLPAEPHCTQHNLNIDPAPHKKEGRYRFGLQTANLDNAHPAPVAVRVVTNPRPSQRVRDILLPQLQRIAGFKYIASLPPARGFGLQLPDFPNAQVQDGTRLLALFGTGLLGSIWRFLVSLILIILGIFGIRYQPKYEARFQMQPGQLTNLSLAVDLSDALPGEAYVFDLTHVENNVVKGGSTVVVVAI